MKTKGLLIIIAAIAVALPFFSAYTVDETEQVVVTQFGKVIGTAKEKSGLYWRLPFIQTTNYFPKNLQTWDGDPGQIPTKDKMFIRIDSFARWKITNAVKFFETVRNTGTALRRLDGIIDPAVRNLITENDLIEVVRKSNRKLEISESGLEETLKDPSARYTVEIGRQEMTRRMLKQAQPKLTTFGIELVDVKIKRINYIEQIRQSVYQRMIAERNQMAEKFRSEGRGEAEKWLGKKERELKQITSEAYRKAQEIKGEADAEATAIFAKAFGRDPEFYSFTKTLEIYNESLDESSTLVLSTDSEFFKYLKGYTE